MQSIAYEVGAGAVSEFNGEHNLLDMLRCAGMPAEMWQNTSFRTHWSTQATFEWRNGQACLVLHMDHKLGAENGRLYVRWNKRYWPIQNLYRRRWTPLPEYRQAARTGPLPDAPPQWTPIPLEDPKEFNQFIRSLTEDELKFCRMFCWCTTERGEGYCPNWAHIESPIVGTYPNSEPVLVVPMRERLAAFGQAKFGLTNEQTDALSQKIWQLLASYDKPLEVSFLTGDDIVEAYENEVGGQSCMTSRTEFIQVYALNPDCISLAVAEKADGSSSRALCWEADCGTLIIDRVYSRQGEGREISEAKFRAAIIEARKGPSGVVVANTMVGDDRYFVSGCVLPDTQYLPYLDNASIRRSQPKHGLCDFAFGHNLPREWQCQHDYECGGPYGDGGNRCICRDCGEADHEENGIFSRDEFVCESCRDCYSWSEYAQDYIEDEEGIHCEHDGEFYPSGVMVEWGCCWYFRENLVYAIESELPESLQQYAAKLAEFVMENE